MGASVMPAVAGDKAALGAAVADGGSKPAAAAGAKGFVGKFAALSKGAKIAICVAIAVVVVGVGLGIGLWLGLRKDAAPMSSLAGVTGMYLTSGATSGAASGRRLLAGACSSVLAAVKTFHPTRGEADFLVDGGAVCAKAVHTLEAGAVIVTETEQLIVLTGASSAVRLPLTVDGKAIPWGRAKSGRSGPCRHLLSAPAATCATARKKYELHVSMLENFI